MKILHLFTEHQQLSLRAEDSGKVQFLYLGRRLANPNEAETAAAMPWPVPATDFDARGHWGNYSGEYALHASMPDGSMGWDLRLVTSKESRHALYLLLADPRYPHAEAEVFLEAYAEDDIFTQRIRLRNGHGADMTLLRGLSAAFPLRADSYHITTFRGNWAGENQLCEECVKKGNTLSVSSCTGIKTAEEGSPCFIVSLDGPAQEESGCCLLGALAWSGNYTLTFKHSTYGHLFVGMGHDFSQQPYNLYTGKQIELPTAILVYSEQGKGNASRRLHHYLRRHVIPHGTEARRTVLNSWEGVHFDVHEPTLHAMIERSAELGVELFVLDDGWFGKRRDDTSSLGDWYPDPEKLPHGLGGLTAKAQACGIDFGLWMEPEMISPKSGLYAAHPEKALCLPHITPRESRHQLVRYDEDQYTGCDEPVADILSATPGISYIKWDCNRNISDPGTAALPADRQGNLYFDYIISYYRSMEYLRREFPQVTFQCCSSGGGRVDLGAARFHEEFWLSDNTDAFDRLRIQWADSHFLPANAMACHVTASPNLYTKRRTSIKFRFDVALMGRLGLELDPRTLSAEERAEFRSRIALSKRLRPLTQGGDLYRLVSPFDGADCALLFVGTGEESGKALLLAYTTERAFTDQHVRIPLRGLKPGARYHIEELEPDGSGNRCPLHGLTLGGDTLLASGMPVRWNAPMQSCVILLTKTDSTS